MDWFVQSQVQLRPGERLLNYWRQSLIVLFWKSLAPAFAAAVLVVLFVLASAAPAGLQLPLYAILIAFSLVILLWAIAVVAEWYVHIFVLTNKRLIRREGVLIRSRIEAQLPKIQNTTYRFALIEKWLGIGSVKAETASAGPDLVVDNVRGAARIAEEILAAADAAKAEVTELELEHVRHLLGERLSTSM